MFDSKRMTQLVQECFRRILNLAGDGQSAWTRQKIRKWVGRAVFVLVQRLNWEIAFAHDKVIAAKWSKAAVFVVVKEIYKQAIFENGSSRLIKMRLFDVVEIVSGSKRPFITIRVCKNRQLLNVGNQY